MTKSSIRVFFSLLCALVLAGCAAQIRGDHTGPDAGNVVIGLGAAESLPFQSVTLYYRRIDPQAVPGERRPIGQFALYRGLTLMRATQPRDYASEKESGVVLVHSLPAGDYELHTYKADLGNGYFYPTTTFSIRFSVRAREVVYLGNYQAQTLAGQNAYGQSTTAGARFFVSNRLDSELALARAKAKDLPATAYSAVPDLRGARDGRFVAAAVPR